MSQGIAEITQNYTQKNQSGKLYQLRDNEELKNIRQSKNNLKANYNEMILNTH